MYMYCMHIQQCTIWNIPVYKVCADLGNVCAMFELQEVYETLHVPVKHNGKDIMHYRKICNEVPVMINSD